MAGTAETPTRSGVSRRLRPGLEGVTAFHHRDRRAGQGRRQPAVPRCRHRGSRREPRDLLGRLGAARRRSVRRRPPARRAVPLPVHTGDVRVDVQAALAMLAPIWGYRPLLDIDDSTARDNLARASVMALSYVAQSARGIHQPAVPQAEIDGCDTVTARFMTRWKGDPDPKHIRAIDAYWVSAAEARPQRLDVHRPRHRLHRCRRRGVAVGGDRRDVGAAARRRRAGPADDRGGRAHRRRPRSGEGHPRPQGEAHGLRSPGLPGEDPRARVLRRTAQELGVPRFEVASALEQPRSPSCGNGAPTGRSRPTSSSGPRSSSTSPRCRRT